MNNVFYYLYNQILKIFETVFEFNVTFSCFSYSILMGSTDARQGALERKIKSIHIHPKHKDNQYGFDVGIIELDEIIEFNDYIQQVCVPYLPMDTEQYKEYDRLTISGHYNHESCNASETIVSMEISSHQVCL